MTQAAKLWMENTLGPLELGIAIGPLDYGHQACEEAVERAIKSAAENLPPGTMFEIRGKVLPESGFARKRWGVAWYWRKGMDNMKLVERVPHREAESPGIYAGHVLIARLRTPA